MRPHGRAQVSQRNPRAFGICDRCGFLYNHDTLQWQFDYAGAGLINKRILVCNPCLDTPQEQLRSIILPADPVPIMNPRVQDYTLAETDYQTVSAPPTFYQQTGIPVPSNVNLLTQDGQNLTTQPMGIPDGLEDGAIMPLYDNQHFGVALPVLSVVANGTPIVTVTCYQPHGLVTNSQISLNGLTNNLANGFYSVTVTTATAFTYQTGPSITAGNLFQSTSRIVTAEVGLPYGYNQIPQTGM